MKKRYSYHFAAGGRSAEAVLVVARGAHDRDGNRILVSGNLELTQVDLSFKIAGRMIERTVDEGDWVKKGDLIARLDPVQLQQQTLRDQAQVYQRAIELRAAGDVDRVSESDARKRRRGAAARS